jgi:hypothetical protein
MTYMSRAAMLIGVLLGSAPTVPAQLSTTLAPETSAAFDRYIAAAEPKILEQARGDTSLPLLGTQSIARVRGGELVMRGISEQNGHPVPHGLIHDWVGGIFIPDATLEKVAPLLQDFDNHKRYYPEIIDSRLVEKNGSEARGSWVMRKKKIITVVLRAELDSLYKSVNASHGFVVSRSGPVVEIKDHGTPKQGQYPAGQGHGFLWKFNGYWTLHEADGGVYAECRVISLSRDVPTGLGWIVSPFVRSMPRESLEATLRNTREAVRKRG